MGLSTSPLDASASERLVATLLCLGAGMGLGAEVALLWMGAGVRAHGGAPTAALAAGLAVAVCARCAAVLAREDPGAAGSGDEIGWVGLLVGAGIPVGFTHMGAGSAPLAVLTAVLVWALWWLVGQVCGRALVALSTDLAHARRGGDLGAELQGAVFSGTVLAAAAALLVPAVEGRAPSPWVGIALAVQCGSGCVLVAAVHRRALLRRAAFEGATVLPSARPTNTLGVVGLVVAALLVGTLARNYPPLLGGTTWAHFAHVAAWLAPTMRRGGSSGLAQRNAGRTIGGAATGPAGGGGTGGAAFALLVEALGLVLIGFAVWAAVRGAVWWWRHRSTVRWGAVWRFFTDLWAFLLEALAALLAGFRLDGLSRLLAALRLRGGVAKPAEIESGAPRRPTDAPRAPDARRRVRAAYRHLLSGAGDRGHRRPHWATPRVFRRLLAPKVALDPNALGTLTQLYEEARYSVRPIAAEEAVTAEQAARQVVQRLREGGGGDREG